MAYSEFDNPLIPIATRLEICKGAVDFNERVIENLRSQIKALRGMLERFIDDPEDIDEVQYAHIKKFYMGEKK